MSSDYIFTGRLRQKRISGISLTDEIFVRHDAAHKMRRGRYQPRYRICNIKQLDLTGEKNVAYYNYPNYTKHAGSEY